MYFIDIHTHTKSERDNVIEIVNIDISDAFNVPDSFFSAGIHPWNSGKTESFIINDEVLQSPYFIAVGECGLDKIKGAELPKQIALFEQHIQFAEKHKKPMIIHCVRCYNEIIELHKKWKPKQAWIIHGFNGSSELAKSLVNEGVILSVGAAVMNKKRKIYNNIINIPLKNILLETDDQTKYLINDIYLTVSEMFNIGVEELKSQITDNFKKIFPDINFFV